MTRLAKTVGTVASVLALGCGRIWFDPTTDARVADDDVQLIVDTPVAPCTVIPGCPGTAFVACDGICYANCPVSVQQSTAEAQCVLWGGHLASIRTSAQPACVSTLLSAGAHWLGYVQAGTATLPDANWTWIDGTPTGFENWIVGEPDDSDGAENGNDNCSFINNDFGAGRWGDEPCGMFKGYLCSR